MFTRIARTSGLGRRRIWQIVCIQMVLIGCLVGGCRQEATQTVVETAIPEDLRQIIIIDIDTLRADHLGCYGYQRETSPNLDMFASESVVFDWAFSQAPNTPPSQTSILTGLYPTTHGMIGDDDRVPDEVETLAEVLLENGFKTAGFHGGGYLSNTFNIGQGFEHYEGFGGKGLKSSAPQAIQWLREHRQEDFLLFLHTYDTHTPYGTAADYPGLFLNGLEPKTPGFEPTSEEMGAIRLSVWTDDPRSLAPNDLEYAKALYDAEIRYVDEWVGRLMTVFRQLELLESAVIVVISDHGEEFQEHGSVLHEKLFRSVTHVPLMIRLPGGVAAKRVSSPVECLDLMPTLLELTGITIPSAVQGDSLVPWIQGSPDAESRPAFSESPFFGVRRAVVIDDLHLLYTTSKKTKELYRYQEDRDEQIDVLAELPDKTQRAHEVLMAWQERIEKEKVVDQSGEQTLDEQTEQQLRELGYIQ